MNKQNKRGLATAPIFLGVIGALGLATAAVVYKTAEPGDSTSLSRDLANVQRGSFDVTIPASGELAANNQVEIRNRLKNRAVILWIVDEGTIVKKGERLLQFNDDDLKTRLENAEDQLTTTVNNLASAESNLSIRNSERESDLDKADLEITLADIALNAWRKGDAVSKREQLDLDVQTASKNLKRLQERFVQSEALLEEKFISLDEYKRDEIELLEANARVTQANRALDVYDEFLYMQDEARKQSDLDQAKAERIRTEERYVAILQQAKTDVKTRVSQVDSAEERIEKLKVQLADCTINAPSDGLVVYATSLGSSRHGMDESPPQVGAEMQSNKLIMLLPDTSEIIVELKVNEALSGQIKAGQKVKAMSDALSNLPLTGEVISVGVLAETGGWRDPNRRDYKVRVMLDQNGELGLKPSMRCRAEVFVGLADEILYIPVSAIHHNGGQAFVYVPDGNGFAQREVAAGQSSELYLEISSGLEEGDQVLLRAPRPEEITTRLATGDGDSKSPEANGRRGGGGGNGGHAKRGGGRPSGGAGHGGASRGGSGAKGKAGGASSKPSGS